MPLEYTSAGAEHAALFGTVAERYDRYRSGYPDELTNDLVASAPASALDVGCGTGKLAVPLLKRGIDVLGVDPDERMAAIAWRYGIPVEIATFEGWRENGRTFDLIVSGQAWHWVEPGEGGAKVARLLRPGGTIARCWNYHAIDADLLSAFEAVYRRTAPGIQVIGHDPSGLPDADDRLAYLPAFTRTRSGRYRWSRDLSADAWIGMISTFGDHLRLPVTQFRELANGLVQAIVRHGGTVEIHGGTYAMFATRAN